MAYTKNMTEGKSFPIIFTFFLPVLFSTLLQQLYSIVDTIIVGKGINDLALAAVGASGGISFFIFGFIMGLGSGMGVLMAQAFGSGDYARLRKSVTMGIVSCGFVGISIMIVSLIFIRPIMVALNTPAEILNDAIIYIAIILASIPLGLAYNAVGAILNALGDSRTPLIAVVISSAINIVLDLVFILHFHMGVGSAAGATLIAQGCAAFFCYMRVRKIEIVRLKKEDWKLDFKLIGDEFKVGVPLAFMNSVTAIGSILLQYFVNRLGVEFTAAYSACMRIVEFMMQPCAAAGMTMSTFAGQNLGAGKIKRIYKGLVDAGVLAMVIAGITTVLLIFFPGQIASLMLSDAENIAISVKFLRICGAMMWSISLLFLVRDTCQGMGYTFVPMLSGFLELAARVIAVIGLIEVIGFNAVAVAEVSAWSSAFVMNGVYLFIMLKKLRMKFADKELSQGC